MSAATIHSRTFTKSMEAIGFSSGRSRSAFAASCRKALIRAGRFGRPGGDHHRRQWLAAEHQPLCVGQRHGDRRACRPRSEALSTRPATSSLGARHAQRVAHLAAERSGHDDLAVGDGRGAVDHAAGCADAIGHHAEHGDVEDLVAALARLGLGRRGAVEHRSGTAEPEAVGGEHGDVVGREEAARAERAGGVVAGDPPVGLLASSVRSTSTSNELLSPLISRLIANTSAVPMMVMTKRCRRHCRSRSAALSIPAPPWFNVGATVAGGDSGPNTRTSAGTFVRWSSLNVNSVATSRCCSGTNRASTPTATPWSCAAPHGQRRSSTPRCRCAHACSHRWRWTSVLLTHAHEDHVAGCVRRGRAARSACTRPTSPGLQSVDGLMRLYGVPESGVAGDDRRWSPSGSTSRAGPTPVPMADGEVLDLGGVTVQLVHAPGHTCGPLRVPGRGRRARGGGHGRHRPVDLRSVLRRCGRPASTTSRPRWRWCATCAPTTTSRSTTRVSSTATRPSPTLVDVYAAVFARASRTPARLLTVPRTFDELVDDGIVYRAGTRPPLFGDSVERRSIRAAPRARRRRWCGASPTAASTCLSARCEPSSNSIATRAVVRRRRRHPRRLGHRRQRQRRLPDGARRRRAAPARRPPRPDQRSPPTTCRPAARARCASTARS